MHNRFHTLEDTQNRTDFELFVQFSVFNTNRNPLLSMKYFLRIAFALILFITAVPLQLRAQAKIIGGKDVAPGVYPWMVALVQRGSSDLFQGQFCGGALIHPYWVLTAAHCVDDRAPGTVEVWADITDLDNPSGAESSKVRAVYIHPSYNSQDFTSDIALLLLETPITSVTPIAYARSSGAAGVNETVRVIGWGQTQETPPVFPTTLQSADLTVLPNAAGNNAYGTNFDSRYVVAGFDGADTCFGDSGGPLFDPMDSNVGGPLLLGITSFGLGCPAQSSTPGIYANVGTFSPWISQFLAQPTGPSPQISISNGAAVIPNGSQATSRVNGTDFGKRLKPKKKKTKQFFLSNAPGSIPLSVASASVSGKNFSLLSSPPYVFQGTNAGMRVRFKAPRSGKKKRYRGTVVVLTNDVSDPVYAFRVQAKTKKKKRRRRAFSFF